MSEAATPILTREDFDTDVDEALDKHGHEGVGEGWYCIRTSPFPCPAEGCTFVAYFMTAAHRVVVWPSDDDPAMLREAHRAQALGRTPRIVEYQQSFGPCLPWDLYRRLGNPVHGVREKPCEEHGGVCSHETRTLAGQWLAHPDEWCGDCMYGEGTLAGTRPLTEEN